MADISKLEQQADLLMQNVMGWENSTLQRIGKRIGKYGKLSLSDVKSINNIATVKQDMDAITKELANEKGWQPVKRDSKKRYLYILGNSKKERKMYINMCRYEQVKGGEG